MNARDVQIARTLGVGLVLDLGSKAWVVARLSNPDDRIDLLTPWLAIVHARNPGAAFGLFEPSDTTRWALVGFAMLSAVAVYGVARLFRPSQRVAGLATGLALTGILGNGIDRLFRGNVVDMIAFTAPSGPLHHLFIATIGTPHWPIFNIADIALVLCLPVFGAAILDLDSSDSDDLNALA